MCQATVYLAGEGQQEEEIIMEWANEQLAAALERLGQG